MLIKFFLNKKDILPFLDRYGKKIEEIFSHKYAITEGTYHNRVLFEIAKTRDVYHLLVFCEKEEPSNIITEPKRNYFQTLDHLLLEDFAFFSSFREAAENRNSLLRKDLPREIDEKLQNLLLFDYHLEDEVYTLFCLKRTGRKEVIYATRTEEGTFLLTYGYERKLTKQELIFLYLQEQGLETIYQINKILRLNLTLPELEQIRDLILTYPKEERILKTMLLFREIADKGKEVLTILRL